MLVDGVAEPAAIEDIADDGRFEIGREGRVCIHRGEEGGVGDGDIPDRGIGRGSIGVQHQRLAGAGSPCRPERERRGGTVRSAVGVAAGEEVFEVGIELLRHGLIPGSGEVGIGVEAVFPGEHGHEDAVEGAEGRQGRAATVGAVLDLTAVDRCAGSGRDRLRAGLGVEAAIEGRTVAGGEPFGGTALGGGVVLGGFAGKPAVVEGEGTELGAAGQK